MNAWSVIFNIKAYIITSAIVGIGSYALLHLYNSMIWTIFCICVSLYFVSCCVVFISNGEGCTCKNMDSALARLRRS